MSLQHSTSHPTMKKLKFAVSAIIALFLAAGTINAQSNIELLKERNELRKASKKELNEKASKDARKEAKQLRKQGWASAPGALPLEKQLDRSYLMQMEYDDDMLPMYIMAEAMSIGENYDAAKMQALELAKQNLAGQIQTEISALVENSIANKQLSKEEAASITKSVSTGKNLIIQSIGRTIIVVEAYRTLPNKNKEVLVRLAYNAQMAKAAAKRAVYDELGEDVKGLQNTLDEIIGW